MSWISAFIKSSIAKTLWKLSVQILQAKVGQMGKTLMEKAKSAAIDAELSGKSGSEKRDMVLEALRSEFKGAKEGFLQTAVQLAWMWLDEFLKENEGNINKLKYSYNN